MLNSLDTLRHGTLPTKPATHVTMSLPIRTLLLYSGARSRRIEEERRLTALGDTALDVLELDVVGVVGLDIGGETVEGALDGFLGGRVHHTGLSYLSQHALFQCNAAQCAFPKHTYCAASSGVQLIKVILLLEPSPLSSSYSTSKTA